MKLFKLLLSLFLSSFLLCANSFAEEEVKQNIQGQKLKEESEYQKVIDEYKAYVAKVPPEVRDEVITYRKEIANLNKQKRLLYRKLSQDAQEYLQKEQDYKAQLPMKKSDLIKETEKPPAEQK